MPGARHENVDLFTWVWLLDVPHLSLRCLYAYSYYAEIILLLKLNFVTYPENDDEIEVYF